MTTTEWALNIALLAWVLLRNLGTKPITRRSFTVPLVVVAVAAGVYLRDVPTGGHDLLMELVGAGTGLALGVAAHALTRVGERDGHPVVTAGAGFAALWLVVIGGRMAFAYLATHSLAARVGQFSMTHQITGAPAWRATFVLLALGMVVGRLTALAGQATVRTGRAVPAASRASPGSWSSTTTPRARVAAKMALHARRWTAGCAAAYVAARLVGLAVTLAPNGRSSCPMGGSRCARTTW